MKTKQSIILLLLILLTSLPVSAFSSTVDMSVEALLVTVDITLTSDVTINPNATGNEENIITATNMKIVNDTSVPMEVSVSHIESYYSNEFVSYNNSEINWSKLGTTDTNKYIAFSINRLDIMPNNEESLGILEDKWSNDNELILEVDVKTGYAWENLDDLERVYPITLIIRVGDEDIPVDEEPKEPIIENLKHEYNEIEGSVTLSADLFVPNGMNVTHYVFSYAEMGDNPTIDVPSDSNLIETIYDFELNRMYEYKVYIMIDGECYYSEPNYFSIDENGFVNIFSFVVNTDYLEDREFLFRASGGTDFTVIWGDGSFEDYTLEYEADNSMLVNHTFYGEGVYTIRVITNKLDLWFESGEQFYKIEKILSPLPESPSKNLSDIFYNQSYLYEIPEDLFVNNPLVTSFDSTFNYSGIEAIPANLFKYNTLVMNFSSTFSGCIGLEEIPEDLFKYSISATNFKEVFSQCTYLKNIPENLFYYNESAEDFSSAFSECENIETIPANLFANNELVTTFKQTFGYCYSLETIPPALFYNNELVTDFEGTFSSCESLTTVPSILFTNNELVTTFEKTFGYCYSLDIIPTGLFDNNELVTTFKGTFFGCAIENIPTGLFDNNPLVTSFESIFEYCSDLEEIPANLFDNNEAVTTFQWAFFRCESLENIPIGLFDNNEAVTTFRSTFHGNSSLTEIPMNLFSNNLLVTDFTSTFFACMYLTGNAPDIWSRVEPTPNGSMCFYLCEGLTNYDSIPSNWK